jgi:hypothetical protein
MTFYFQLKTCDLRLITYAFLYFLLNFSTLPAVSSNLCNPVKNGWHFEQISTLIFCFVERVWITSPQAQVMVAA